MPDDLLQHLKKVRVRGQQINLSRHDGPVEDDDSRGGNKRPFKKNGPRGKRPEGGRGRDSGRGKFEGGRGRNRD